MRETVSYFRLESLAHNYDWRTSRGEVYRAFDLLASYGVSFDRQQLGSFFDGLMRYPVDMSVLVKPRYQDLVNSRERIGDETHGRHLLPMVKLNMRKGTQTTAEETIMILDVIKELFEDTNPPTDL